MEKGRFMMRRQMLNRLITQAFKFDLLICFGSYLLKQFNEQFAWIFITSLIVLFWLCVAGGCLILDFLVNEDKT